MSTDLDKLLKFLEVERVDKYLFIGNSPKRPSRVFGGQVLSQALNSAIRTVEEQRPDFCAPITSLESWLFANARLLALGFATEDAIERGYGDEFVVLPPVFRRGSMLPLPG